MKKGSKIKRVISICLIFLFSINAFAATVSDNDGASFITKAEFDALKSNFQTQLDTYNLSIDSKIDTAIAAYLNGIKISHETTLVNNKSKLSYPLKFQMKNKLLDLSTWNTCGTQPYWAPNWIVYLCGYRYNFLFSWQKVMATTPKKIDSFYNGTWDTSLGKFVISNSMKNVAGTYELVGNFYSLITYEEQAAQNNAVCFFTDQHTKFPRGSKVRNAVFNRSANINANDRTLVEFRDGSGVPPFHIEAAWDWGGNSNTFSNTSSSTANNDYLNSVTCTRSNWWVETEGMNDYSDTKSLSYETGDIDLIMNQTDPDRNNSTGKRIEIPVAYNNLIYLTNRNGMKADLFATSALRATQNFYSGRVWYMVRFYSPGWTLEPQFNSNATYNHAANKRSLLEPNQMVYEVTTAYTTEKKYQTMDQGIMITEIPSGLNEIDFASMEINISSEESATPKYIVLSKSPITITDHTSITSSTANLIKLGSSETTINEMKLELSEGLNTIYFKDIAKDDILYFKILWDISDKKYCNLVKEPVIKVQTKN